MKPHDKILLKNHREIIAPVSVSVFDLNGFSYFSSLIHWLAFWPVLPDIHGQRESVSFQILYFGALLTHIG